MSGTIDGGPLDPLGRDGIDDTDNGETELDAGQAPPDSSGAAPASGFFGDLDPSGVVRAAEPGLAMPGPRVPAWRFAAEVGTDAGAGDAAPRE